MGKAKVISLLFVLGFVCSVSFSQNSKIKRGHALFAGSEFEKAIEWYEAGLKKERDTQAMKNLVTACIANRKYEKAEYWFSQLTTELGLEPQYYFYYGQTLMTNGKPEEARKWFAAYGSEGGDLALANGFVALIDEMERVAPDVSSASVEALPFNSDYTDFGATVYGDGVVFASERWNFSRGTMHKSRETETPLLNLYYVEQGEKEDSWSKPKPMDRRINTTLHEGPAAFSPDGSRMYLNRSNRISLLGKSPEGPVLGLYVSEMGKKKWEKPELIDFPNKEADYLHPAVSPDGKWLYFAANLPGGEGGYDLYKCAIRENDFGDPVHLGPQVNSPFDELFPHVQEGRLYFASNGHPGYGGLDLFVARQDGEQWAGPRNMGQPVNSQWDDFSLSLNEDCTEGFLASNRGEKNLNDDLYQCWLKEVEFEQCPPEAASPLCYKYVEKGTQEDLPYQLIYEWSFGDGETARGVTARHCYQSYGTYLVTLTAIDSLTGEPLFSQAHYRLNVAPPAGPVITLADEMEKEGNLVFNAQETTLPGYNIEGYYWDFGAGFQQGGAIVEETFTHPGKITVKLGIVAFNEKKMREERFCVSKDFNIGGEVGSQVANAVNPDTGQVAIEFSVVQLKRPEFRIQLGTSTERVALDDPVFQGMRNIVEVEEDGIFRYFYDSYENQDSALSDIIRYRKAGFPRAVAMTFAEGQLKSPRIFRENWLPDREVALVPKPNKTLLKWKDMVSSEVLIEDLVDLKKIDSLVASPNKNRYLSFQDPSKFFPLDFNLNLYNRTDPLKKDREFKLASLAGISDKQVPVVFKEIYFESGTYSVPSGAWQELFRITRFLLENPQFKIEIIGHTDGVEVSGLRMALRRASSVAQFLVLSGCRASSVKLRSVGARFPLVPNSSERNKKLNRRVEFRILTFE